MCYAERGEQSEDGPKISFVIKICESPERPSRRWVSGDNSAW